MRVASHDLTSFRSWFCRVSMTNFNVARRSIRMLDNIARTIKGQLKANIMLSTVTQSRISQWRLHVCHTRPDLPSQGPLFKLFKRVSFSFSTYLEREGELQAVRVIRFHVYKVSQHHPFYWICAPWFVTPQLKSELNLQCLQSALIGKPAV